jgi:hypothetical protein
MVGPAKAPPTCEGLLLAALRQVDLRKPHGDSCVKICSGDHSVTKLGKELYPCPSLAWRSLLAVEGTVLIVLRLFSGD